MTEMYILPVDVYKRQIRNRLNRDLEHFIHEKTRLDTIVFSTITEVGGFE